MSEDQTVVVIVEETGSGKFIQSARTGRHSITLDEPVAVGGNDAGPGPYELLLMALGACTSMTLRMYAQVKAIPLEGIRVELKHHRIYAKDCTDCVTQDGRVDEIERNISLMGELSEEQQNRLLEIANRCPVHRTLTSETKVRSRIVPA